MVRFTRLGPVEVLEQERHAAERTVGQRTVGVGARSFELAVDHGVQRGVDLLDPRDRRVDELAGMDLAVADEAGEPGCVVSWGRGHRSP